MTIKRILVAHDFSDAANRALGFAADIAEQAGASIDVVYVYPDIYDGRGDPSLSLPNAVPGQGERYIKFLEEELQRVVSSVVGASGKSVPCHIVRGDPVKRLESFAQEIGADTICIGATGKGAVERMLLGSISQLVLRTSELPVLVVP